MANPEHVEILKQGVEAWNRWRDENLDVTPNLSGTDFDGADFGGADFGGADLSYTKLRNANLHSATLRIAHLNAANISGANLTDADLSGAYLLGANLKGTNLSRTNFSDAFLNFADLSDADVSGALLISADLEKADLSGANISRVNLSLANLTEANLSKSIVDCTDLSSATLVRTNFTGTTISDAVIYGVSAWGVIGGIKIQKNLRVTPLDEPAVYVDNLEVAQFVYLLLHNEKIRDVIDTIGEKGVLILGRFTPERKAILDAIRDKLRELGFVPMMFDFEKPTQRDFTETIKTLAGMSRFIIADITNPKSTPLELQATMPDYMIPFVPIINEGEKPFSMFRDLKQKYGEWVLDPLEYDSPENLLEVLEDAVVQPALNKSYELIDRKADDLKKRHVRDYRKT